MTEILFLDLDDTILDFGKAERRAVRRTLEDLGHQASDAVCTRYSQLNLLHWQMLERGEITRDQVLLGRFQALFRELGWDTDPGQAARSYEGNLSLGHDFMPGAEEVLPVLSAGWRLFLASNGTKTVQDRRVADSGIGPFFEGIFISEELGANKPHREYFEKCFAKIPDFSREKTMIVGDSLTSDILGGTNAGIRTCWVNPAGKPGRADIVPDYEIRGLAELPELLSKIG